MERITIPGGEVFLHGLERDHIDKRDPYTSGLLIRKRRSIIVLDSSKYTNEEVKQALKKIIA